MINNEHDKYMVKVYKNDVDVYTRPIQNSNDVFWIESAINNIVNKIHRNNDYIIVTEIPSALLRTGIYSRNINKSRKMPRIIRRFIEWIRL